MDTAAIMRAISHIVDCSWATGNGRFPWLSIQVRLNPEEYLGRWGVAPNSIEMTRSAALYVMLIMPVVTACRCRCRREAIFWCGSCTEAVKIVTCPRHCNLSEIEHFNLHTYRITSTDSWEM
ncbi:hypothetical protein SCLCIDRAFT_702301 [Scleroderma citrinum Foug A]|uniref:Uncharacterized protein n=1 Tax=Scleroderma citrinum Foug A TaxID=1036808 RepID=A0A0C3A6Y5_9AGAM|nr:hypothetical protein SCLCIDRAFT_702301 [Scleroderma citrinum Foug A]